MKRYYCRDVRKAIGYGGPCCPSCHDDDDADLAPLAESEDDGDLATFCCELLLAFPDDTYLWSKLRKAEP